MLLSITNLSPLGFTWPISLEYFSGPKALGLFVLLGLPIVWLGMRSLAGLGKVRQWVAIGVRLAVLLLMILILGGIRVQRQATDVEVMVLRDISQSTANVDNYPGKTLQTSIDDYLLAEANNPNNTRKPDDKIGQISFQNDVRIDALPSTHLSLESHSIRDPGSGTDIAAAIQLGLATLQPDSMHRLVLISDGNPTQGDTDAAVDAAIAQHVPIDVMPMHYDVQHEVLMDKFVAPTWKRENEPFTLDIILKSTNSYPVTGKLTVLHQGVPMDLDPMTPGIQPTLAVTLQPGLNPFHIKVPALKSRGVHQFHASFEADDVQANAGISVQGSGVGKNGLSNAADTLTSNNSADAFTFVQGKGQILYVDGVEEGRGDILMRALNEEGVEITPQNHIAPPFFPTSLIELENYDAIILANVSRGPGVNGISEDQQKNLATYVHDMGGGLVMIGGPDTFGAGGWQGSKLEEVLPVNMDIPAERQIPKGALVLAMDSAEAPEGNYWGEQCAIKAMETLSAQDDMGIVTFGWQGTNGGYNWDLPLGPKGDGSKAVAAVKKWGLGDLPSFEQAINVVLDGDATSKGLIADDAKQKHIIVITDDDPQMPLPATIDRCIKNHITVSTITVFPHQPNNIAAGTKELAKLTGGRSFGPIENNPSQLPQIFVKEATVVRRSLITENEDGIQINKVPTSSDMVKGLVDLPKVKGMVLTSRKGNPQIEIPLVAGKNADPVLAHWQTGLGRAAVFTSDANNKWGVWWVGSAEYNKFWAQILRAVARPPMSSLFDVQTTQSGNKGHITVEALDKDSGFMNFLNIAGTVDGPSTRTAVRLTQTGPGRYEANFDTPDPGTYVAAMQYIGQKGDTGTLLSGVAMNNAPETRDLQSNDARMKEIAERTGGRVLTPFEADITDAGSLFSREGLPPAITPLPVWETLLPFLVALILIDVATRRIAWDWNAMKAYAAATSKAIRSYTTTRKIETTGSVDALKRVRDEGALASAPPPIPTGSAASATSAVSRPDPKAKFNAPKTTVEGDITKVVGGASDKPIPSAPKKIEPKGGTSGGMGNLMEAKRRAQQKIRERETGE
jgi:uncharacterized membrane protein